MKHSPSPSPKTVSQDLLRLSLINNLKQKIESLNLQLQQQKSIIEGYKRSTKTTLINEQEIEIQKLNDQNRRLLLVVEEMRARGLEEGQMGKYKGIKGTLSRMSCANYVNAVKKKDSMGSEQQQTGQSQNQPPKQKHSKNSQKIDYESKYFQLLLQNDKIRKQLLLLKSTQKSALTNRHSNPNSHSHSTNPKKSLNERSSILMQTNMYQADKMKQKCYELEAELANSVEKGVELKERVSELEELLERALQINKSMKII